MKTCFLLCSVGFAMAASAQQPATPKPFTGFGKTTLDRKSGSDNQNPFGRSPITPVPRPPAPATPSAAPGGNAPGIALSPEWTGHLSQSSGGQTMKMNDLQALLAGYGTAELDTAPHPEVAVYDGKRVDGTPEDHCRITWLMPLDKAEALLFKDRSIAIVTRAVAPGFPDGLFLHTYDVKAGIYNRLCIVTDSARPVPQVVSLVLEAQTVNRYPYSPPYVKIERDWHTLDYVNTENRGQSGLVIDTRVHDLRKERHYIIVNTTGGVRPPEIPEIVLKPAQNSPKQTATWYVPEPLIRLILYSLSRQLAH